MSGVQRSTTLQNYLASVFLPFAPDSDDPSQILTPQDIAEGWRVKVVATPTEASPGSFWLALRPTFSPGSDELAPWLAAHGNDPQLILNRAWGDGLDEQRVQQIASRMSYYTYAAPGLSAAERPLYDPTSGAVYFTDYSGGFDFGNVILAAGAAAVGALGAGLIGGGLDINAAATGLAGGTEAGPITGAITGGAGIGTASTTALSTASTITNAVTSGGSTASTITSAITAAVSDPTLSNIAGVTSAAFSSLKDVLSPITNTISAIAAFNRDTILPITTGISTTINTVNALVKVLHSDLAGGLQGLLDIPLALSNALGSLDATWSRAFSQLDTANRANITGLILPGFVGNKPGALGAMSTTLEAAFAIPTGTFKIPPGIHLTEGTAISTIEELMASADAWLQSDTPWVQTLGHMLAKLGIWATHISGTLAGLVEAGLEEQRKAAGMERLGEGDVQSLYKRGELSTADATEELRLHGYSAERAAALLTMARPIFDTGQILDMVRRRYMSGADGSAALRANGWLESDIELLLSSNVQLPPMDTVFELLRRGSIDAGEAERELQRQGYDPGIASRLLPLSMRLLGLQDVIAREDRSEIVSGGGGFTFLSQSPPEGFTQYAAMLGIDEPSAVTLWSNHWAMLPPQLAVQGFFRGYLSRAQLAASLAAVSLPVELHQNYIDLQRPLIPARSIGTMISHGILSETEARNVLRQRGFDDFSAQGIIDLAKSSTHPPKATQADTLHGLTQDAILKMYDAGSIEEPQAIELLVALGYTADAAQALVDLQRVHGDIAARAAEIELVLARAKAGVIDNAAALDELTSLHLTGTEQTKALARLTSMRAARTKIPSEAMLLKMHKHGLLSDVEAMQALELTGYSEAWAQLIIQTESVSGKQPPG